MKYTMLIDQTRCIGCGACTVECKGKFEGTYDILRTKMIRYESGTYPDVKLRYRKHACMHCLEAPCQGVCPVSAIFRVDGENGNMVEIHRGTCIGCGACVGACPFGVPQMDPETNKAEKCSFCAHRVIQGKETYCSEACPVGAIAYGTREEVSALGEERVAALQAAGRDKASIYGLEDTGVLLLLDDDLEAYELVPEGFTVATAGWNALSSYGGLAVVGAFGGGIINALKQIGLDFTGEEKESESKTG